MSDNSVVIAGSARTPMGGLMGSLSSVRSPELGATAIKAAIERSGLKPVDIQEVIPGWARRRHVRLLVLPAFRTVLAAPP